MKTLKLTLTALVLFSVATLTTSCDGADTPEGMADKVCDCYNSIKDDMAAMMEEDNCMADLNKDIKAKSEDAEWKTDFDAAIADKCPDAASKLNMGEMMDDVDVDGMDEDMDGMDEDMDDMQDDVEADMDSI